MRILEDLYCGRIAPHEHQIEPESEYEKLLQYIICHNDDLKRYHHLRRPPFCGQDNKATPPQTD